MFYSKSTGGFYSTEIHGDNIPSDAVEISTEEHSALIDGQSSGNQIAADESGYPVLVAPSGPTDAELQYAKNAEARAYLNSTDWYLMRNLEDGVDIPEEITKKRAAARAAVLEV